MLIATCTLAGALAVLWCIVRVTDAYVRLVVRRGGGGGSLLVQLWALVLLPGAALRLLVRLLVAALLRVRVTQARLDLPNTLDARGTLPIDTLEITPTDVLRESLIATVPVIAISVGTLVAASLAGYPLPPDNTVGFAANIAPILAETFRRNPGGAITGTYAMVALSTAMALPGPPLVRGRARRSWLVSLIAPVLVWLVFVALEAWPLRLLPFTDGLTAFVRMTAHAVALAVAFDLVLLVLVGGGVWLRRRARRADTVLMPTQPLPTRTLPNGDTVPMPHAAATRPFRRIGN